MCSWPQKLQAQLTATASSGCSSQLKKPHSVAVSSRAVLASPQDIPSSSGYSMALSEAPSPAQGLGYYYNPTHGTTKTTSESGTRPARRAPALLERIRTGAEQWDRGERAGGGKQRAGGHRPAHRTGAKLSPAEVCTGPALRAAHTRTLRPCTPDRRISRAFTLRAHRAQHSTAHPRTQRTHSHGTPRTAPGPRGCSPANSGPAEPLSLRAVEPNLHCRCCRCRSRFAFPRPAPDSAHRPPRAALTSGGGAAGAGPGEGGARGGLHGEFVLWGPRARWLR